ncbi:uncharacterized protein [Palaemon carinicauda]|uniref:uncharacterized protein isoform X2 n=1 Tax=Palaemon carinicauda TaxID=392227 RepID=UPI0035B5EA72
MLLDPPTNNTDHVLPTALATLAPAQAQGSEDETTIPGECSVSGVQVVVIVLVVVVVTALVSCVLGHSKMGARLWSQRRTSRAARLPPSPQHSQTILTPNTFTHSVFPKLWRTGKDDRGGVPAKTSRRRSRSRTGSRVLERMVEDQRALHNMPPTNPVLYVCEGMSGSVGEAMAAARDRATRYQSVQQDFALGLPHQVRRPDGEERRHCTIPNMKPYAATSDSQEAETTREYIKPPPNKTLFDVPPRSYSMGMLNRDWDVVSSGMHPHQQHHHNHYSAPLDPAGSAASSSSSSPSSSWPSWGSGDESSRGSPRRVRKTLGFGQKGSPSLLSNCIAPFTSPKNERAPQSPQDGGRRANRHQGVLNSGTLMSSQDQYCPGGSTWSDITTVSVPCGSSHSPNYPSGSGASQGTLGSGMGVQGDPPHLYEQSSQSGCSAPADHELPPLYSEVIENPTVCRSVSRPSEQRTNSGKI